MGESLLRERELFAKMKEIFPKSGLGSQEKLGKNQRQFETLSKQWCSSGDGTPVS
jgi:hypothetical protein